MTALKLIKEKLEQEQNYYKKMKEKKEHEGIEDDEYQETLTNLDYSQARLTLLKELKEELEKQ